MQKVRSFPLFGIYHKIPVDFFAEILYYYIISIFEPEGIL